MAEPPRQLPLALPVTVAHGRDDYVVSRSNRAAFELVTAAQWPSDVMVLIGPEGAGKTHLAAVLAEVADGAVIAAAALAALDPLGLAGRTVIVEDAGEGVDERALFHLFNVVRQHGGRCLVTARRPPAEWSTRLADLASRLRAATPIELGLPDDPLLEAVLGKLFADRQIAVDPAVLAYLARRMERSFAAAVRLVEALDREALAAKGPITRTMAGAVLARDRGDEPEPPGLDEAASTANNPS
jgi:chromosomal replication initiation ATPase DnaA